MTFKNRGNCPACGQTFTDDTSPNDPQAVPVPGNWGICAGCAVPLIFNHDLSRRTATEADLAALAPGDRKYIEDMIHVVKNIRHA